MHARVGDEAEVNENEVVVLVWMYGREGESKEERNARARKRLN